MENISVGTRRRPVVDAAQRAFVFNGGCTDVAKEDERLVGLAGDVSLRRAFHLLLLHHLQAFAVELLVLQAKEQLLVLLLGRQLPKAFDLSL